MKHKLILGTVQMGQPYGINNSSGKVPLDQSFEILRHAHEAGIVFLDSAEAYGDAHQVIGQYHREGAHTNYDIITKIPHQFQGSIEDRIESYLEEMNIDTIWGLMFHSFESYKSNPYVLQSLLKLKNKGLVRHVGVSIYTNEEFEQVINDQDISIIQFPFNIFDNYSLRGTLIRKAKEKGKILHTRSAFLQGLFFMNRDNPFFVAQKLKDELTQLDLIVKKLGITIGALALNYCLSFIEIDNVLIGVDSVNQLKSNLASVGVPLGTEVLAEINKIKIRELYLINPSLWK